MSNTRKDLLRTKGRLWVFDEASTQKKWRELTVVDNVKFQASANPVEIRTPSGITIYQTIDLDPSISFDWYHPGNNDLIELMYRGALTSTTYDGLTAQAKTVTVNFRQNNEAVPLLGFDGDLTVVTVSAVVLDSTPATTYTVTTDYTLAVDATTGVSMITHVSTGSIALNTDIRVTYSFTPLASKLLEPVDNGNLVLRTIMIDSPLPSATDTKYRRYILPNCTITSDLMHSMLELGQDNTSPNILPVSFKYQRPDTNSRAQRWMWFDTVNV